MAEIAISPKRLHDALYGFKKDTLVIIKIYEESWPVSIQSTKENGRYALVMPMHKREGVEEYTPWTGEKLE